MDSRKRLSGTPEPMHVWEGYGGVRLAGDSWGDSDGPLVILMHGVGQTRHSWKGTGELLGQKGYFVVSYDSRGHGDSGWSATGDYSRLATIRDLQCLLQSLGRPHPVLAGASMGGAVSLIAVGEGYVHPKALVLVDMTPHTEPAGVGRVHDFLTQHDDGFESLEEVAQAIQRYRPRKNPPKNLNGLAKNVRLGCDGRYYWHWDPRLADRERDTTERKVEAARQLAVPTLLVRGANSDVVSEDGARKFLDIRPDSAYVNVAGARHMIVGDEHDIFTGALVDFLESHVPT